MKFVNAFFSQLLGHAMLLLYAMTGWFLVFTPGWRERIGQWLQDDLFGKERFELMLYQSNISFAHGEPALAFWWMSLKAEFWLMLLSGLGWLVAFHVFSLPGPVWLVSSFAGVLAVEGAGRFLYMVATAAVDPTPPTMPDDNT